MASARRPVLASVLLFAACGGPATSDEPTDPDATTTPDAEVIPPPDAAPPDARPNSPVELFATPGALRSRARDFAAMGLAPDATVDEIEAAFYDDDALVLRLTPELDVNTLFQSSGRSRYRWHLDRTVTAAAG